MTLYAKWSQNEAEIYGADGSFKKEYLSLSVALSNAVSGDTVKLTKNVTCSNTITLKKGRDFTIDLN